jgi:hypothetical protein
MVIPPWKLTRMLTRVFKAMMLYFFLDYDRPVVVESYDPALGTKTYTTISRGLAYDG